MAELICECVCTADDYMMVDGVYEFEREKLGYAHKQCQNKVESAMIEGVGRIAVANTLTTIKELNIYFELSKKYSYKVFTIIVENRMDTKNIHNVSDEILEKMKQRFHISL